MRTIDRETLRKRLQRGDRLTFVEALPGSSYRKSHLPGAINIPHHRIDDLAPSLLPDKRAEIVVYCSNLACQNSEIAARRLTELGYQHVYDFAEGKQDWLAAELPLEKWQGPDAPARSEASPDTPLSVACTLDESERAARSDMLRRELLAGVEERLELATGYAYRFPGAGEWKAKLDDFVDTERRCCSFFHIELTFEPGFGPIWLRLTGDGDVKKFIDNVFDADQVVA